MIYDALDTEDTFTLVVFFFASINIFRIPTIFQDNDRWQKKKCKNETWFLLSKCLQCNTEKYLKMTLHDHNVYLS